MLTFTRPDVHALTTLMVRIGANRIPPIPGSISRFSISRHYRRSYTCLPSYNVISFVCLVCRLFYHETSSRTKSAKVIQATGLVRTTAKFELHVIGLRGIKTIIYKPYKYARSSIKRLKVMNIKIYLISNANEIVSRHLSF